MTCDPFAHETPRRRMEVTLRAMGASGWVKAFPYAMIAYDPHASVLCIVVDHYADADISADWQAACRFVEAAGRAADDLAIPGDDLIGVACGGLDPVMGMEWPMSDVLAWRLDVPGTPWIPEDGDTRLVPESAEVTAFALAEATDSLAVLAALRGR